jgi:hypothetical protein
LGLEKDYFDILDKLESKVTNLQYGGSAAFKKVIVGWKTQVSTFPLCFILPDPDAITPASTKKDKHVFRYILASVVEKADVTEGLKDCIKLACALYDELVKDRRLDNTADNLEVTRIEFHWRRTPSFIRHYVAMFIEVHRFYV